jgi:hypothetical protein
MQTKIRFFKCELIYAHIYPSSPIVEISQVDSLNPPSAPQNRDVKTRRLLSQHNPHVTIRTVIQTNEYETAGRKYIHM